MGLVSTKRAILEEQDDNNRQRHKKRSQLKTPSTQGAVSMGSHSSDGRKDRGTKIGPSQVLVDPSSQQSM